MSESAEVIRERRRLKILNKSEERMKKLLGCSSEQVDEQFHSTSDEIDEQFHSTSDENDTRNSVCATHFDIGPANIDVADMSTINDRIPSLSNGESYSSNSSHVPSNETLTTTSNEEDITVQCEEEDQSSDWPFKNILMMFFGVLVRMALVTEFGRQVVQTIFNPFMTIEIVIFGFERTIGKDWNEKVNGALGRIWLIAFQLTGMNADLIKTYRRVVSLVTSILQDFTFYFFAFLFTHLVFSE